MIKAYVYEDITIHERTTTHEHFFLVSDHSYDWLPVIRSFVRLTNAQTVTVQSDKKATDRDDFLTDERGRLLKQIPVKEFEKYG